MNDSEPVAGGTTSDEVLVPGTDRTAIIESDRMMTEEGVTTVNSLIGAEPEDFGIDMDNPQVRDESYSGPH